MTGRAILRLSPIALVLVAAACGGGGGTKSTSSAPPPPPTTATTPVETTLVRVYFLRNDKVAPVARVVRKADPVTAALASLLGGPSVVETQAGFSTALPSNWEHTVEQQVGTATVTGGELTTSAKAQLVYTLTQFSAIQRVQIDGKRRTRADFEDETPLILVESPLPFQTVHSPLRVTGTANTFEATFQYELTDASGKVVAKHFVTATSGTGTRGTYDVTIPFTVTKAGEGKLAVFENSAENGRRVHEVDIPLDLEP